MQNIWYSACFPIARSLSGGGFYMPYWYRVFAVTVVTKLSEIHQGSLHQHTAPVHIDDQPAKDATAYS